MCARDDHVCDVALGVMAAAAAAPTASSAVPDDDANAWTYITKGSEEDVKRISVVVYKALYSLGRTPVPLGPADGGRTPDIVVFAHDTRSEWEDGQVRLTAMALRVAFLYRLPRGSAAIHLECSFSATEQPLYDVNLRILNPYVRMLWRWQLGRRPSLIMNADDPYALFNAREYHFDVEDYIDAREGKDFLSAAMNTLEDVITRLGSVGNAEIRQQRRQLVRSVHATIYRRCSWRVALPAFYAFLYALETVQTSEEIWKVILRRDPPLRPSLYNNGTLVIDDIDVRFTDTSEDTATVAINTGSLWPMTIPGVVLTHMDMRAAIAGHPTLVPDVLDLIAQYVRVCSDTPVRFDTSGVLVPSRTLRDWRARVEELRREAENLRRQQLMEAERARSRDRKENARGDTGLD